MNTPANGGFRGGESGFSLVELLVGMAIMGVLLALALPSFSDWMLNIRLRNQADEVLGALQKARAEALRRNRFVRFQLVTSAADGSLTNACALTDNGNRWIVSHGDPTGACGQAQSLALPADNNLYSNAPVLLLRGVRQSQQGDTQTSVMLTDTAGAIIPIPTGETGHPLCFTPTGQLTRYEIASRKCTASTNPGTTMIARGLLSIGATTATCAPAGSARCLRVMVGANGETRLCDPALAQLASRTKTAAEVSLRDVRGCFCDPAVVTPTSLDYCQD